MELHKEEEEICRELGDKAGLSRSLGSQAVILKRWGQLKEAMELHKEEERICRELGDKAGLSRSLGNQAVIIQVWGQFKEAMELHKEEEGICRELGDKAQLLISLSNQAVILRFWGKLKEAMELHKEEERICRELGDKAGLYRSLNNQALICQQQNNSKKAFDLISSELEKSKDNPLSVLTIPYVNEIIERLEKKQNYENTTVSLSYDKLIKIGEIALKNNRDDIWILCNLAYSYKQALQFRKALIYYLRVAELHSEIADSYIGLARLYYDLSIIDMRERNLIKLSPNQDLKLYYPDDKSKSILLLAKDLLIKSKEKVPLMRTDHDGNNIFISPPGTSDKFIKMIDAKLKN